MAKYTLGSGISQFKGSEGGATFQKCGKVFAFRKRAVPVQKKSVKQTQSQNLFGAMASRYRTLTLAQRNSFANAAATYARVNSLGTTYHQTGRQMQLGTNFIRVTTGRAILNVTAIAVAFTTIAPNFYNCNPGALSFTMAINPITVQSGFDILVYASRPTSAGLQNASVNKTLIGFFTQNQNTSLQNWFTRWQNVFGPMAPFLLQWIYVRMDLIQNNSGQVRQSIEFACQIS
jgi:hypothetical protein